MCFTDPCEFDFSSWSGQPPAVLTPEQWATGVRSLNGNFDSTQHISTNHVVTFDGDDAATCVSYMHAQHWFSAERLAELGHGGDQARWCTLGGYYTNSLRRDSDGWRIRRCQLDVTWVTGDRSIFDIAGHSATGADRHGAGARGAPGQAGHHRAVAPLLPGHRSDGCRAHAVGVASRQHGRLRGLYRGSAAGFVEWLWPGHVAMVGHRHEVSNILIELQGDRAASETYVFVTLRVAKAMGR